MHLSLTPLAQPVSEADKNNATPQTQHEAQRAKTHMLIANCVLARAALAKLSIVAHRLQRTCTDRIEHKPLCTSTCAEHKPHSTDYADPCANACSALWHFQTQCSEQCMPTDCTLAPKQPAQLTAYVCASEAATQRHCKRTPRDADKHAHNSHCMLTTPRTHTSDTAQCTVSVVSALQQFLQALQSTHFTAQLKLSRTHNK